MLANFNKMIGEILCKMVDHKRVQWHVIVTDGEVNIKREYNAVCPCCGTRLLP